MHNPFSCRNFFGFVLNELTCCSEQTTQRQRKSRCCFGKRTSFGYCKQVFERETERILTTQPVFNSSTFSNDTVQTFNFSFLLDTTFLRIISNGISSAISSLVERTIGFFDRCSKELDCILCICCHSSSVVENYSNSNCTEVLDFSCGTKMGRYPIFFVVTKIIFSTQFLSWIFL